VPLGHLKQNSFTFNPAEGYLILLISRTATSLEECKAPDIRLICVADFAMKDFPPVLWQLISSAENLTPRGQHSAFSSSTQSSISNLDGAQSPKSSSEAQEYSYQIHAWNGQEVNNLVKAQTLTKALELDQLI